MAQMKSLIFVYPLTPSLKAYYELISVNAAQENIEIYEIDDPNEFNQLFQSLGATIALFGDPKKCLKCLVANKKYTATLGSKILLFSPQLLHKQTLTKFHDLGLTEFLVDPMATKSISYKVNLLLKSLPQKAQAADKEEIKTFKTKEAENSTKEQVSTVKSMMIIEDPSAQNYNHKKEKKTNLYILKSHQDDEGSDELFANESESYEQDQRPNPHKADNLSSYWRSRERKAEIDLFGDAQKGPTQKRVPSASQAQMDEHQRQKDLQLHLEKHRESLTTQQNKIATLLEKSRPTSKSINLNLDSDHDQKKRILEDAFEEDDTIRLNKSLEIESEQNAKNKAETKLNLSHSKKTRASQNEDEHEQWDHRDSSSSRSLLVEKDDQVSDNEQEEASFEDDDLFKKAKTELSLSIEAEKATKQDLLDHLGGIPNKSHHDTEISLEKDISRSKFREENIEKYIKNSLKHSEGFILEAAEEDDELNEDFDLFSDEDFEEESPATLDLSLEHDAPQITKHDEYDLDLSSEKTKKPKTLFTIEQQRHEKKKNEDAQIDQSPIHLADNRADQLEKYYKGMGNSHKKQGWRVVQRVKSKNFRLNFIQDDDHHQIKLEERDKKIHSSKLSEGKDDQSVNSLYKDTTEIDGLRHKLKLQEQLDFDYLNKKQIKDEQHLSYDQNKHLDQKLEFDLLAQKKDILTAQDRTEDELSFDESQFEDQGEPEDNTDTRPLISAKPCGLINLIQISESFRAQTPSLKEHMQSIATTLHHHLGGQTSFYVFDHGSFMHEKFVCYPEILAQMNKTPESLNSWQSLESIKYPFWKLMNLPVWSDHSFQDTEIDYFHPFFEEGFFLGFAICYFQNGFQEHRSKEVEILIESARALYLELATKELSTNVQTPPAGNVLSLHEQISKPPQKKGFLGRLLGS